MAAVCLLPTRSQQLQQCSVTPAPTSPTEPGRSPTSASSWRASASGAVPWTPLARRLASTRSWPRPDPAAYLPSLASVLTNYGTALAGVGDTRAALKATRKAVQIRRRLAEVDPVTHPPELARALAAFAEVRAAKGLEVDEARAAADEAFTIFQELARQLPAVFIGSVRATDRIVAKLSDSQRPGTKQPSVLSLSPGRLRRRRSLPVEVAASCQTSSGSQQ